MGMVVAQAGAAAHAAQAQLSGEILLGTNQFVIAAVTTIVLGFIDNSSAMPMAIVIAGCGIAATGLNFLTLGSRLDVAPPVLAETHT